MTIIKETLDAFALTKIRTFEHDRSKTVGASEIGQCARRTWYVKNNQEMDDDYTPKWGATMRGNVMEDKVWEPALRARFGDKLRFAGKDQKTLVHGHLSATPDACVIDLDKNFLSPFGVKNMKSNELMMECKTADPRTNLESAKAVNVYQTHVQMGLIRKQTNYKPNYSLLSYMNASWWDEVTEFVIPYDDRIFRAAEKRATEIITATKAKDLAPEGWIAGGRECLHCPYLKPCGIERRNLPFQDKVVVPKPVVTKITKLVAAVRKHEEIVDKSEIVINTVKDKIKGVLRDNGLRKVPGLVSWTTIKPRIKTDMEAFSAAALEKGVDIADYQSPGETGDRLTITGGDDGD